MAKITKQDIEYLARLARLELSEEEKEKFTSEISSVLEYIEKLNEVDTKGIEDLDQVTGLKQSGRVDSVRKSISRDEMLKNAPHKKDGLVKAKAVK
ncbi:MAG: Asp-tRNA(Asn)/Glu-tRNA(Gln) amidotransferase subunit GatC [bacterium]